VVKLQHSHSLFLTEITIFVYHQKELMHKPGRLHILIVIGFLLIPLINAFGAIVVDPGNPQTICKADSVTLGGSPTASGGTAPYTYTWSPSAGLNNPNEANPHAFVSGTTTFTVTVQDALGSSASASVTIFLDNVGTISAGRDTTICPYLDSAAIGAITNPNNLTYTWAPSYSVNCPTCAFTYAKPPITTTYTLSGSDGLCNSTSTVTVSVKPEAISVTSPVTINIGQSVVLNATGFASNYQWTPNANATNLNSETPEVSPQSTTTYTITGKTADGCYAMDTITVNVLTQDTLLYIYNTFTPNGDGINDTWYIGNINFFPNNEVLVYNRYGRQIYQAYGYANQWDGTVLGTKIPDATYYYIVTTGTGQKYEGTVTIIRYPQN
jgi:gliding motility-associated-like protein